MLSKKHLIRLNEKQFIKFAISSILSNYSQMHENKNDINKNVMIIEQFGNLVNEHKKYFDKEFKRLIINEKQGIPSFIFNATNIIVQKCVKIIESYDDYNGFNEINNVYDLSEYSDELKNINLNSTLIMYDNSYKGFNIKSNGGETVGTNINVVYSVYEGVYNIHELYNIISHEIMHAYQYTKNKNTVNQRYTNLYSKMLGILSKENVSEVETALCNIIYYSYKEEQDAYTVGGRMYFDSIENIDDCDFNELILKSPYRITYERLVSADRIMCKYFTDANIKKQIDYFCEIVGTDFKKLHMMLKDAFKTLITKFSKNIYDFMQINKNTNININKLLYDKSNLKRQVSCYMLL